MKSRIFCTALAVMVLILLLMTTGCAAAGAGDVRLPDKGLEMVAKMDELASSEAYVSAMSASADLASVIAQMAAGDYAVPTAVYRLFVPKGAMPELIFGGERSGLSDALTVWLEAKACASIPTQVAARSGANTLAAASCVTYGQALVCKTLTEPAVYLYQYAGDYSAMVSFVPGQDGAVNGTACFVPADDELKAAASKEAIAAWINGCLGYMQLTAEKVR